jgi:hypothetical protein
MPSISAQFSLLTLHLEVAWVYTLQKIGLRKINRQLKTVSNYYALAVVISLF